MIIKKSHYTSKKDEAAPLELLAHPFELLFFDIETTGFDRVKDQVISITTAHSDTMDAAGDYIWTITQWFTESLEDEKKLLCDANLLFDAKPVHFTYNGHSFDIPFLYCKYQYYNIFTQINKSKCYDLYRIARQSLVLDSYKLKAIEIALGIDREDLISGKECVELYHLYERNRNPEIPEKILLHNFEDVVNMIRLSKLLHHTPQSHLELIRVIQFEYKGLAFVLDTRHITDQYLDLHFKASLSPTDEKQFTVKTTQHYFSSGEHVNFYKVDHTVNFDLRLLLSNQNLEGHLLQFIAYTNDSISHRIGIADLSELLININGVIQWHYILQFIFKILDEKNQLIAE